MIETKLVQGAGTAGAATRRKSTRDSMMLLATIRRAQDPIDEQAPVRVRNLSAIGLMADYQDIAVVGDAVVVTVRGIGAISGKVAWLKRGQIGVTFDNEIDPLRARKPIIKQAPQLTKQRPL